MPYHTTTRVDFVCSRWKYSTARPFSIFALRILCNSLRKLCIDHHRPFVSNQLIIIHLLLISLLTIHFAKLELWFNNQKLVFYLRIIQCSLNKTNESRKPKVTMENAYINIPGTVILGSLVWPFRVTWRHRSHDHSIAYIPIPISGPLEPSLL